MRTNRIHAHLAALLSLCGTHLSAAPSATEQFFSMETVPVMGIEIDPVDQDILRRHPRNYVRATVRHQGTVYREVGVHLKGTKLGSFRPLDDKPSLTLNFDKFADDQEFHGMDKVYLNNSVEDPTYMDEDLGGHFFRAAGLPAPRTTHVRVELNGEALGLYVLKQGFDRSWLKQCFEFTYGNLYEGGEREDITAPLEKDVGESSDNRDDLEALAAAAQEADPAQRWIKLEQRLDVEQFVTFAALEVILCHWDGYCMNVNNYRIYSDPKSGKMVFIPHGMDILFEEPDTEIEPPWVGIVAKGLMSTPQGRDAYRSKVRLLVENTVTVDQAQARITRLEKRLEPILDGDDKVRFQRAVAELREQVRERGTVLQQALANTQ